MNTPINGDGNIDGPGDNQPSSTTDKAGHPLMQSGNTKTMDENPRLRHRRCNILLFTINAGFVIYLWMIGVVYTGAVVRTLERRFGLRSTQTGILMACGDIVHMCIVVFVGYFGRRGHKPRFMCVTALFSAAGNLLMASPHWLYNSHAPISSTINGNNCTSTLS